MKRHFGALAALVLAANLSRAFAPQQQPLCVWQSNPETIQAGCYNQCTGLYASCCQHWHLNLQYDKCTSDGDLAKDQQAKKYSTAEKRMCNLSCTFIEVETCSHFANQCTTKACPTE